jgi:hypothetical protein
MTVLTHASSTNSGADLWVLPDIKKSRQFATMDWYLNFQMTRATGRTVQELPAELSNILQKCELPKKDFHYKANDRLLIGSSALLPNRWVLQLSFKDDLSNWCSQISEIWTQLRKPSFRVFLPTGLSAGDFQTTWKQIHSFDDFSIVVD